MQHRQLNELGSTKIQDSFHHSISNAHMDEFTSQAHYISNDKLMMPDTRQAWSTVSYTMNISALQSQILHAPSRTP